MARPARTLINPYTDYLNDFTLNSEPFPHYLDDILKGACRATTSTTQSKSLSLSTLVKVLRNHSEITADGVAEMLARLTGEAVTKRTAQLYVSACGTVINVLTLYFDNNPKRRPI